MTRACRNNCENTKIQAFIARSSLRQKTNNRCLSWRVFLIPRANAHTHTRTHRHTPPFRYALLALPAISAPLLFFLRTDRARACLTRRITLRIQRNHRRIGCHPSPSHSFIYFVYILLSVAHLPRSLAFNFHTCTSGHRV